MPRILLAMAILLCCGLGLAPGAQAQELTAQVRWVVDGDTIILDTGQTVRLMGIDAPELGRDERPGQYYALRARQWARRLVQDRTVHVDLESARTDRFQRLVAVVSCADGTVVNQALLAKGAAFVCIQPEKGPCPMQDRFLQTQRRAIQQRVGFWSRICSMAAAADSYIGNRRSRRVHSLECPYGQAIHAKNRRRFSSLKQAFRAGFAPGRRCTPWPRQ